MGAASPTESSRLAARYLRAQRLTRPAQFVAVLRERPIVRSGCFALHIRARSEEGSWRFGLVVPKRFEARSVGRNAIKRTWREALRLLAPRLDTGYRGHDLVVRLLAKPGPRQLRSLKLACRIEAARLCVELQTKLERIPESNACVPSSSS
jgi:ribonuclease P protein component